MTLNKANQYKLGDDINRTGMVFQPFGSGISDGIANYEWAYVSYDFDVY